MAMTFFRPVAVRAIESPSAASETETIAAENAVYFRGQAYTEAEYDAAKASGAIDDLSNVDVAVYAEPPSFGGEREIEEETRCSLF